MLLATTPTDVSAQTYSPVFYYYHPDNLGSSTLSGAVLVENGQRLGVSDSFVNQEWLWFNIAAVASALLGGALVQHLSPEGALHGAALIVGVAPFLAIFGAVFLISE